jgi:heat-inducible transcriptional repressor
MNSREERFANRTRRLFKLLVEHYLNDGTPVASRRLASYVDVSSATVRSIMADLEARGLISSPHTSAGRVPTDRGLRLFVDSMISVQPLDTRSLQQLRTELNPDLSTDELVSTASQMLSGITRMAGLVTMPRAEQVALRQVEFLRLSGNRVLAILVVDEREVQNRVIHTDREYDETELHQAAEYINRRYHGKTLSEVRSGLVDGMRADRDRLDRLMQTAIDVASKTFAEDQRPSKPYVVSGESNLVEALTNTQAVRDLFDAFAQKSAIVHLLDRCLHTEGIQLFIGAESGNRMFEECSLITARYEVNGEVAGVLGVIGPTRMAYQEVIPIVDVTARMLGSAMTASRA